MVDIIEMRYISLELNKNLYEHLSFSNNNKITFINLQCARQSPNHLYVLSHLNFKTTPCDGFCYHHFQKIKLWPMGQLDKVTRGI